MYEEHQDNMGGGERDGSLHRSSKCLASNATSMGSPCRAWEEDSVDASLWSRVLVSGQRACSLVAKTLTLPCSIVGLSAVRIYLYRHMDMYDWTYHTGRIVLFNGPEPALGILAGCLPVMSPCLRLASNKIRSTLRSARGSSEQQVPCDEDAQYPPTIGRGGRISLKSTATGSFVNIDVERLVGDVDALNGVTIGATGVGVKPR